MEEARRLAYGSVNTDPQYRDSALNYKLRWEVYSLVEPPVDFEGEVVSQLGLNGNESILDVGCGDGQLLLDLRLRHGHRGNLFGIDKHPDIMFASIDRLANEPELNIQLLSGLAEQLRFPSGSMDVVTAFFMLYHTDHKKALSEINRVLKPGGAAAITTSGDFNKIRHRQFEDKIASFLNVEPPTPMNGSFDTTKAEEVLPLYFNDVERINYRGNILLRNAAATDVYLGSLVSMQREFMPTPAIGGLRKAIEQHVEPVIRCEIDKLGYFRDFMDRSMFICRQTS